MMVTRELATRIYDETKKDRAVSRAAGLVVAGLVAPHLRGGRTVDATRQTPLRFVLQRRVFQVARRPNRSRRAPRLASPAEAGDATAVGRGGGDAAGTDVED